MRAEPSPARLPKRRYLVEIHDLHPATERMLEVLLSALPEPARRAAILLVVPKWGDLDPLDPESGFVDRLNRHPAEKVLHGLTHTLGPSLVDRIWFGTENHAEFARLGDAEARARIDRAGAIFRSCFGSAPAWFCPPRWRLSEAGAGALAAAGFEGFMLADRLVPLGGASVPIPAVCFDEGRRRWKIAAARALRRPRVGRLLERGDSFRLTLHPSDPGDPATWSEVGALIEALGDGGWEPLPFAEALGR